MRSLLALAALTAAAACPTPAVAAEGPTQPLRALVFDVTYAAHTTHERRTSGFNGAYGVNPGDAGTVVGVTGPSTAAVGLDGADSGRMTIEVIAATADAGLVVDAQYTGKLGSQPKMRIAILKDGRLSADPTQTVDPAVLHVLPLLARGFIAERELREGVSWSVLAPPPARGTTTYRVTALQGENAMLSLEGSLSVPGANGFDETDRGTTKYATDLIVPLVYDVNSRVRRQYGTDETVTTDAHLTVTLVSDTFAKARSKPNG